MKVFLHSISCRKRNFLPTFPLLSSLLLSAIGTNFISITKFPLCLYYVSNHHIHGTYQRSKKEKKNHDSWHIIFELLVYLSLSFTVMVQMYLQLFKLLCACLLFNCFKSYIDYALINHLFDLFIS